MRLLPIIAAALLLTAPVVSAFAQSAFWAEEEYEPTEAELDALIDEAIAEEGLPELADSEPTEPEVLSEADTLQDGVAQRPLEDVLGEIDRDEEADEAMPAPSAEAPPGVTFIRTAYVQEAQDTFSVDESSPKTRCEYFGSDPIDPDRLEFTSGAPILDDDLDTRFLLKACGGPVTPASARDEAVRRQGYIRARALMMSAEPEQAMEQFRILCDANYGAACHRMSLASQSGVGRVRRDQAEALRYAKKAAGLGVAAAGSEFLRLSSTDWVSRTNAPVFHQAVLDGEFDRIPHTISTQRMLVTVFSRLYDRDSMWRSKSFSVDDDQNRLALNSAILLDRAKTAIAGGPPRMDPLTWEGVRDGAIRLPFALARATATEVAPAAEDAMLIARAFDLSPDGDERAKYTRNLSLLMARWAKRTPAADSHGVCRLFKAEMQANCLPMADYTPGDPIADLQQRLPPLR